MGFTGLLTAIRKDHFRVLNYRELLFNDCGDRVAQVLHVASPFPSSQCRNDDIQQEVLIVNTHLLFPHDSTLSIVRLQQVNPTQLNFFFDYISWKWPLVLIILPFTIFHIDPYAWMLCNRSIKFCNTWNLIRKITTLIPCQLYSAGIHNEVSSAH